MKPKCQGNLLNFDVYFYAADVACLPALHVSIIYRCTKSSLLRVVPAFKLLRGVVDL